VVARIGVKLKADLAAVARAPSPGDCSNRRRWLHLPSSTTRLLVGPGMRCARASLISEFGGVDSASLRHRLWALLERRQMRLGLGLWVQHFDDAALGDPESPFAFKWFKYSQLWLFSKAQRRKVFLLKQI
jgi:hypothetical protein